MNRQEKEELRRVKLAAELRESAAGLPCRKVHGYEVYFEKSSDGVSCFCPALPGCVSAGATMNECRNHMAEAIELHLEGMREDGNIIPPRDGRAEPRPNRVKGRTVSISSRVSPEVAAEIERISSIKGWSKTEAIEHAIIKFGKAI